MGKYSHNTNGSTKLVLVKQNFLLRGIRDSRTLIVQVLIGAMHGLVVSILVIRNFTLTKFALARLHCILKLQGCDKVVRTLSQGCPIIATRLPQCNLVTTLAQPCILKLSQGCDKVVARLSRGCTNIVTRLPQCTLSQPCILKLWQL